MDEIKIVDQAWLDAHPDSTLKIGDALPVDAAEPDLEKLRDEKCIPVARAILNDMAVEMMPVGGETRADFQPIVMKILGRTLEADLNLVQENPYVFQLMLGAFSAMSRTITSDCTIPPLDDTRYGAIGKKIISILATANIRLGNVTPEESTADFVPVKEQLNALFAEEKLSWLEVKYIVDSIFGAFKVVQQTFAENVEMSVQRMEAKILGVEFMVDVTMKRLNEVLVTPSKPAEPVA